MVSKKTASERFFQSCANGDLNLIKADMFHSVSPFSQDRYGNNALHLACMNNQPRVLQYLLRTVKRYKTDTQNKLGRTTLNIAASQGAFECIEILLDNLDCDINSTDKNFKNTPLHWCITSKCVEGVKKLLNLGANFKLVNKFGETPLQLAKITCPDIFNIIDQFINNEDEDQRLQKITQISKNTKTKKNISPESSSDLSLFELTAGSSKLDSASFEKTKIQHHIINDTNLEPDLTSNNSNEPFFLDISKFKNGDNSVLKLLEKSIEPVDETSFVSSVLNSGKVIQLTEAGILALEYTKNEITTPIPDRLVKRFLTTSKQCEKNEIEANAPKKESTMESIIPSKGSKRSKSPPPYSKKLKFTETTVCKKSEFEILLEQLNIKYPKILSRVNNSSANSSNNVSSLEVNTAKNNKVSNKNQLVCLNSDINGHPKWVEDFMSLLKEIVEYKSTEPAS